MKMAILKTLYAMMNCVNLYQVYDAKFTTVISSSKENLQSEG